MRKVMRCLVIACVMALLPGVDADAQRGVPDARINRVEYVWNPGYVAVRVEAESGESPALVAASVAFRDPYSHQRIILDAPRGDIGSLNPGGVQQFDFNFGNLPIAPPYEFIVKVWLRIVESHECQKGLGGGQCEDCQRNGFHMEGTFHSTGWIHINPGLDVPGRWNQRTF